MRPLGWIVRTRPAAVAAVNLALVAALCAWIRYDARFDDMIAWIRSDLLDDVPASALARRDVVAGRLIAAWTLAATAGMTLTWLAVLLFAAPARQRGLRAAITLVTLVALWLGVATSLDDLMWWSKGQRMARLVPHLALVAEQLRGEWPETDGELPGLGEFTAYNYQPPSGANRHADALAAELIVIAPRPIGGGAASIGKVERTTTGALRFHLQGPDSDAWESLEWRPHDAPRTQARRLLAGTEGEMSSETLARRRDLGNGWSLARYGVDWLALSDGIVDGARLSTWPAADRDPQNVEALDRPGERIE